jgi:hypothetical protein
LLSGWGFRAHHRLFRAFEVLDERPSVGDTGDPQRAPEGAAAFRQCETTGIGMHMSPPARLTMPRIWHEDDPPGVTGLVNIMLHRGNPQQLGGRRADPATHTGAHRGRATYH